jgi:hypothetical protein
LSVVAEGKWGLFLPIPRAEIPIIHTHSNVNRTDQLFSIDFHPLLVLITLHGYAPCDMVALSPAYAAIASSIAFFSLPSQGLLNFSKFLRGDAEGGGLLSSVRIHAFHPENGIIPFPGWSTSNQTEQNDPPVFGFPTLERIR